MGMKRHLGSFSTSITVSKLFYHQDIRQMGSGNAGATNTLRNFGAHKALLVVLGDGLKAVLAMWLARAIAGPEAMLYAGGAAVLGHIFPVYYGFQGGKGVMSAAAMILAFDWRMFLMMLAIFSATVLLTRFVSLASILAAVSFLPSMLLFHRDNLRYVLFSGGLAAVVIWKHRSNIRRLIQGTESRLGDSKKNKP